MIYVDTSVVLAQIMAEDRRPAASLWSESLVSSRLLQYEARNRLHSRALNESHGPLLTALCERLAFLEMRRRILDRALEPFPIPVRTLDALYLASALFLLDQGHEVLLATYDERLATAGRAVGLATISP